MVASTTGSKTSRTVVVGVVGLIVMLVVFWIIREAWQKGGRPFQKIMGSELISSIVAVVILIIALAAVYYVNKRTK